MIDKVVRYLKKRMLWHRYAKEYPHIKRISEFEKFTESIESYKQLANWEQISPKNREEVQIFIDKYGLNVRGKRVLDLGPGYGDFLDVAQEKGAITVGMDYNPIVVRWLQLKGHLAFQGNMLSSDWRLSHNLFDIIHLKGSIVAEYFKIRGFSKLSGLLKTIESHTADGGQIYICPFFELRHGQPVRKISDPRKCRFTDTMLSAGYEILEDLPIRSSEALYPVTFGKTI